MQDHPGGFAMPRLAVPLPSHRCLQAGAGRKAGEGKAKLHAEKMQTAGSRVSAGTDHVAASTPLELYLSLDKTWPAIFAVGLMANLALAFQWC